jgi:hypothetical protein
LEMDLRGLSVGMYSMQILGEGLPIQHIKLVVAQ